MNTCQSTTKIVVGIDFGTTATRVSHAAWGGREPDISQVGHVFFGPGKISIPSKLAYKDGAIRWGEAADTEYPCHVSIKHLLNGMLDQETIANTPQFAGLETLQLPADMTPQQIIGDFLRTLRGHILEQLASSYHEKGLSVEYYFTVPAAWSEDGQTRMREAITIAGYGTRVFFISEAEAAVVFLQKAMPGLLPMGHYLVCDVGGGTTNYNILTAASGM
ncbi:hypothetical protein BO70DRAFT_394379 [Aspergillus heteromorphus CBS 117.55]|uniref:Actin-like ATPase domain-containing protein n=1 Tax=Aspergillus heteromorphus CBS 117.55 TaxID=1448321 RepID=A0A317WPA4_9EURO|nr:uncharacterized protein BO70DRAFT_394379 [Aspergillus heteromorphus CBS 117.55]PWY87491.1 hypothetical protein BO70DRAFT_394379 [Aspergillus heteromorphus CBS 117.55]